MFLARTKDVIGRDTFFQKHERGMKNRRCRIFTTNRSKTSERPENAQCTE